MADEPLRESAADDAAAKLDYQISEAELAALLGGEEFGPAVGEAAAPARKPATGAAAKPDYQISEAELAALLGGEALGSADEAVLDAGLAAAAPPPPPPVAPAGVKPDLAAAAPVPERTLSQKEVDALLARLLEG